MKLWIANEQTVDIDTANRERGYQIRNNVLPEYEYMNFNIINYLHDC
jgi:hypothetical protein